MSINIVQGEEKVDCKIGVGSVVKSKKGSDILNNDSLFMILDDISEGCYKLVNIKNGIIIASKNSIIDMVNVFELELVTNDIDIVLRLLVNK